MHVANCQICLIRGALDVLILSPECALRRFIRSFDRVLSNNSKPGAGAQGETRRGADLFVKPVCSVPQLRLLRPRAAKHYRGEA
jgi:hypothetical protein